MIFLLNCVIKASVILAITLLAMRLLQRQSAALRHCVLTAGLLSAAVTPGLSLLMPEWNLALPIPAPSPGESVIISQQSPMEQSEDFQLPASVSSSGPALPNFVQPDVLPPSVTPGRAAPLNPDPAKFPVPQMQGPKPMWTAILKSHWIADGAISIWVFGGLLMTAVLFFGGLRLAWIAFHSTTISSGEWKNLADQISSQYKLTEIPRLLLSRSPSLLVTWGWRRPRILLPAGSENWPVDRIRAVLCHELAHVRRRDWIVQLTAEVLRGIYWFNPLLWAACKSIRCESEQASDDAALNCGIGGPDYAQQLLDVVHILRQPRREAYALSMAHPSTLERRFKAILNPKLNRRDLTLLPIMATLAAFMIITLPVSMLRGSAVHTAPLMSTIRSIASVVVAAPIGPAESQQPVTSQYGPEADRGTIQGTVRRADLTAPIAEAQITLEGGPADPKSVEALIQTNATRGVIFNPKRIGTVDEVVRDVTDQAGTQGTGPGFPVFDEALAAFRATNAARFAAESDMDGHFTIKDVPPGDYIIHVEREGFFDLAARAGNPTKVTVLSQQAVTATVSMTAGGVVSGRVRDVSGDPQQNVGVQVFSMAYQNGYPVLRGTIQKLTDDHGAYRLFWLAPGEYYIAVNPGGTPNADATQRTMYPGTLDIGRAMPVSVRAGEQTSGIDIQLPTDVLPKISGKVTSTIPAEETAQQASLYNAALARTTLMLIGRDPAKPDIGSGTARTIGTVELNGGTGTFEVAGILPGSYDLYVRIPQSNAQGGAGFSFAKVPIDVKNENVTGISITVNHIVNVTGSITIDGKAPGSTPIRLHLQPDGSGVKLGAYQSVGQRVITPDGNGTFTSLGVPPGLFRMDVESSLPSDIYLSDVRQGGVSVFDSGIDITSEKPNPLQVVLNLGAGTIEGTALDATGKPQAGAYVVLAPPMTRRQNRALYHTATADANGKFTVHNIAPGTYQLFAWQQTIPAGAFYNAGFLRMYEDRSRPVNVIGKSTVAEQISAVPLQ